MVFGGLELSSFGIRGGWWIEGKLTNLKRKEEFTTRFKRTITTCAYGYGRKYEFGGSNGWNRTPTTRWFEPKTILPTLRSSTLGWLQLCLQGKCTLTEWTLEMTPSPQKRTWIGSPSKDKNSKPNIGYPISKGNPSDIMRDKNIILATFAQRALPQIHYGEWRTPEFLVEPTWGSKCVELRKYGTWRRSRLPSLKRGRGAC